MEVHQHTHTPRKKWTHYLWEFLMLFLAVFCGFLAEYQLEHKIEKDRASAEVRVRNKITRPDACPHASERRKIISFMHLSLEGFVAGPSR